MNKTPDFNTYLAGFPIETQAILERLRSTIQRAAPNARETISYGIPTFTLEGNLVHFAAFKNHIGFYPTPSGIAAFKEALSVYDGAKGSIKFPIDKPLPYQLISKIVKFRVQENLDKAARKKAVKTCKNGHQFFKTSDCPTCPICENERKPKDGFLALLSAPAKRALENKGLTTLDQLSTVSEKEILQIHGIGPSSIPILQKVLKENRLSFKNP